MLATLVIAINALIAFGMASQSAAPVTLPDPDPGTPLDLDLDNLDFDLASIVIFEWESETDSFHIFFLKGIRFKTDDDL